MIRNVREIVIGNLLVGGEGWGRSQGAKIQGALINKLGHDQAPEMIRLSLAGMKRMDVTFAAEVVVEPVRRYLGIKSISVVHAQDSDIAENVAAAALRERVPVTIWVRDVPEIVGPPPREGNHAALHLALKREGVRAADIAGALGISISGASNKLKQLWETGYLMRDAGVAQSGGPEFVYRRIG